uniref:Hexosyltransferase n=1 Tax=Timema monikensis TaxID=170555 RepID=A0A7R9ECB8_9NEOP|nr:unnamed protein product [Timema monikensis]
MQKPKCCTNTPPIWSYVRRKTGAEQQRGHVTSSSSTNFYFVRSARDVRHRRTNQPFANACAVDAEASTQLRRQLRDCVLSVPGARRHDHASLLLAMLEKRRSYGAGLPPSPLMAATLTALVCLSLWHFSSCPGPVSDPAVLAPTYLLLLPGNATSLPPPYPLHKLSARDRNTLIDLENFDFRFNNFPCNETSAPFAAGARPLCAGERGEASHDPRDVDTLSEQLALEEENREHRDMVQGSFRDAYRNMTYKHVMALKWTSYFCPGARYLLKTDDDVFVNSPALLDFLSQDLSPWGARRLILCAPFYYSYVKRSYRSKWRVSPREYPDRVYPTYCAGWAVLYSPDVVFLLYNEAQHEKYFWIDDVHITGTLAARANLTQTALGSLVLSDDQVNSLVRGQSSESDPEVPFLFGSPNLALSKIHRLWELVLERRRAHTPPS